MKRCYAQQTCNCYSAWSCRPSTWNPPPGTTTSVPLQSCCNGSPSLFLVHVHNGRDVDLTFCCLKRDFQKIQCKDRTLDKESRAANSTYTDTDTLVTALFHFRHCTVFAGASVQRVLRIIAHMCYSPKTRSRK